ncbi:MAG: RadC family protein [Clostridia bacterium]|nr:RadC family protein [Clostridia bacterium]
MADKKENPHKGHRKRMREEALKGFDSFNDVRLLEFLLFYVIPQKDTNELAHELLSAFGSVAGVLDADVHELIKFKGITEKGALLLKCVMPMATRYGKSKYKDNHKFKNIDEIGDYLMVKYQGLKHETFGVLCLDAAGKLKKFEFLNEGNAATVGVSFREIASVVFKHNAPCVVIVHNHFETALPSKEDIEMTKAVKASLNSLGTTLLDHIIVSGDDYISMRQTAEFASIFK